MWHQCRRNNVVITHILCSLYVLSRRVSSPVYLLPAFSLSLCADKSEAVRGIRLSATCQDASAVAAKIHTPPLSAHSIRVITMTMMISMRYPPIPPGER